MDVSRGEHAEVVYVIRDRKMYVVKRMPVLMSETVKVERCMIKRGLERNVKTYDVTVAFDNKHGLGLEVETTRKFTKCSDVFCELLHYVIYPGLSQRRGTTKKDHQTPDTLVRNTIAELDLYMLMEYKGITLKEFVAQYGCKCPIDFVVQILEIAKTYHNVSGSAWIDIHDENLVVDENLKIIAIDYGDSTQSRLNNGVINKADVTHSSNLACSARILAITESIMAGYHRDDTGSSAHSFMRDAGVARNNEVDGYKNKYMEKIKTKLDTAKRDSDDDNRIKMLSNLTLNQVTIQRLDEMIKILKSNDANVTEALHLNMNQLTAIFETCASVVCRTSRVMANAWKHRQELIAILTS